MKALLYLFMIGILVIAGTAFAEPEKECDTLHSQEFELPLIPLMKGMADDALEAYAHEVAIAKYKGDEELRECVSKKVGDAVTEVLHNKWKSERGLRNSLYGVYLSAEVSGSIVVFGAKLKGAGFLVKVLTPQRKVGLRFIPVASLNLGGLGSSHWFFDGSGPPVSGDAAANIGLLLITGKGDRANISVSDFANGLGKDDGSPKLGIGGHVGLAGMEVAKIGEVKDGKIIIAGWKGGFGIGAGIDHNTVVKALGKTTARHYAGDNDLAKIKTKIDAATDEKLGEQGQNLNFVAKWVTKIEVNKAYRDVEAFEEMCQEEQ